MLGRRIASGEALPTPAEKPRFEADFTRISAF
jgi:hypothetical protein